eukprot:scaffold2744_cov160-Amphora_coffeaeformis.AAC.9
MVRGNWQHRVEKAEARKTDAKQRKHKADEKRKCKGWVQDLWQQLDRYQDDILTTMMINRSAKKKGGEDGEIVLHLWTDTVPSLSEHLMDLLDRNQDDGGGGKRRDKGRPRSDSIPEKGKKKVHPRSHNKSISAGGTMTDETKNPEQQQGLLLCREAFFKGNHNSTCGGGGGGSKTSGKKAVASGSGGVGGGCRYIHYSARFQTLGAVLRQGRSDNNDDNNALSYTDNLLARMEQFQREATPAELLATEPGAMEFLYYTDISLPTTTTKTTTPGERPLTLSSFISEKLVENNTPASSIYYVALNGVLIFDRLRGGMLLDERDFLNAVVADNPTTKLLDRRTSSVGSQGSAEEDAEQGLAQVFYNLPSTILEHILLFLPDATVAAAAQVCKTWYNEIGQHSPNLWLQLLKRRKWPVPDEQRQQDENDGTAVDRGLCRAMFLENYTVLRDMRALSAATSAIVNRQTVPEIEMGYQDFSRRKHAPSHLDTCVSVHGWSDKLILVGYSEECALRLFEADGFGGDTGELRCKELVYQSVSPYRNTKKRNCQLVAVEIDEHNIGCLCSVSSDKLSGKADILVILRRDEFLLGTSSDTALAKKGGIESNDLKVIDIGEAVLNFVLSSDVVDHRLLPLFDYLNEGFEIGRIDVKASERSLCACGFGRFMVEVSISIPDVLAEDDTEMVQLDRKLVLFSSNFNAIIWAGESYPPHLQAYQVGEKVKVAISRQRTACTVVSKSLGSPEIVLTEIDASGNVQPPQFLRASPLARPSIARENLNFTECDSLLVTLSEIILLEVMTNEVNGELNDVQSAIVFYPRFPDTHQADFDVMNLPKRYLARKLVSASELYVVVFCTVVTQRAPEVDDLAGQWFDNHSEEPKTIAVVVNIKSRCIIGQVEFNTDQGFQFGHFGNGSTTGLAIGSRGVAITGDKARATRSSSVFTCGVSNTPSPKKKKKSSKGKRSGKKDGFARGMSLRG